MHLIEKCIIKFHLLTVAQQQANHTEKNLITNVFCTLQIRNVHYTLLINLKIGIKLIQIP